MRYASWWLVGIGAMLATGCAGGNGPTALTPAPAGTDGSSATVPAALSLTTAQNDSTALGNPVLSGDIAQSALALYTVTIDPSTLSATAELKQGREAAATDDLYLLPIGSFLNARSFVIDGVSRDADTINLGWSFSHPFPAPSDPAGTPNGSTNRADLGVAAALL